MTKSVFDTKAAQDLSAWVVLKGKKQVGRIIAHYGRSRVTVEVHDYSGKSENTVQRDFASGYGYDKFTSALSGMTLDGVKFTNHCGEQIKKTSRNSVKGNVMQGDYMRETRLFPRDYKPRKGYSLANWASGEKRVANHNEDGSFSHWTTEECENAIEGYSNCYRRAGIDILRDLGYTVIQAI